MLIAGINVPTGAIKLTSSNSKVAVSYNIVTGKTSGTATLTIKDKITNAQTTCTVNVTPIANATYYLKNRQTDYYARVKNGTMADGTNAVQYELDGTEYEKWQFSLNSSTGYYTIKSKGSSSAYYLTVKDSVSTLNQEIVLGTSSTANGAQWKVVATTNGAYKLVPKTGENAGGSGVDYVLATNTSLHTNNANLIQGKYLNNSSYRDEWFLIDVTRIYGYKDFRTLPQSQYSSINCHGYAMFRNDMPSGWTTTVDEYIANVAATTGYGPNDYSSTVKHNVSEKTRIDFENWLSTNGYSWVRESSFSENGSSNPLLKNQYRVVLRTGIHNVSFVADGIPYIWQKQYDYHFWYQTYDGTWANKHGHLPIVSAPEQLPSGVTPLTGSTSGWNLSYYKSDYSLAYTYENFYDGDIYVYIITVS